MGRDAARHGRKPGEAQIDKVKNRANRKRGREPDIA